CLFRANPTGTRQGKIVVVQHRSLADPETGGRYTIKRYTSEKLPSEEGGWRHERITLHPDSDRPEFAPIELVVHEEEEGVRVIAEMLMVLAAADD
ncbi:MAG TPA: AAA family ATPase, partial [Quisquiliibacterium sp.]|nr:AAA family ATPase [Quisquiliibacterium sp.]